MAETLLTAEGANATTTTTTEGTTTNPVAPSPSWRDSLPPDLKEHKSLSRYADPAALAKGYVEMEKYQGRSLAIPGETATPAERAAFDAKVNAWRGVPESAEKYTLAMPEGMQADEKGLSEWKSTFHRLGLTQDQVAGLADMYFQSPTGNPQMAKEALRTYGETELRRQWGGAFDHNLDIAKRGAQRVAGPKVLALLEASGLSNHPDMVEFMRRLGKDYQEDGSIPSAQHGGPMGPDDAKRRIAEIRNDRDHPYHKGDKDAIAEMLSLYEASVGSAI